VAALARETSSVLPRIHVFERILEADTLSQQRDLREPCIHTPLRPEHECECSDQQRKDEECQSRIDHTAVEPERTEKTKPKIRLA